MPRLAELLGERTRQEFEEMAMEVIGTLENEDVKNPRATARYSMFRGHGGAPEEVTEASNELMYLVWQTAWQKATPMSKPKGPFTHHIPGGGFYVNRTVHKLFGDWLTKDQAGKLATQVTTSLRSARVMEYKGRGGSELLIRYWDGSPISPTSSYGKGETKPDHRVEKRIIEEADKPVSTKLDLGLIEPPEPTPEGFVAWAEKHIKRYAQLYERYEHQLEHAAELEAKVAELEAAQAQSGYVQAAAKVADLLKGVGTSSNSNGT